MLPLVTQPSQPGNARLAGEIQFGGGLMAQHAGYFRHPRHRRLTMRFQYGAPVRRLIILPSIGRVRFRPAPHAVGMLAVGFADRSSTDRISRFVK